MSKQLTYATVCSGIECMSAAVAPLGGWKPIFFSEIEPFPCSLLKYRYPTVPNLGDMTKIKAEKIGDEDKWRITNGTDVIELAGRLGCLAGGTPCQDCSIAGLRRGMAEGSGTRSSLVFEFTRLLRELEPRYFLFENVPGMLTSNQGRDFAHVIMAMADCGYSIAWRVLDAQYVRVDGLPRAVPQRRRRVWIVGMRTVGHTGDGWRAPAEILFEPQGVRGDTPPRRVTGQGFTSPLEGGAQCADRLVPTNSNGGDVMPALTARDLEARMTGQADRSGGYVLDPSGFDPYEPGGVKSATEEVSGTIVNGSSPGFHNAVCFENHQAGNHKHILAEVAPTMGASRNAQAANNNPLVVAPMSVATKQQSVSVSTEVAATLGANDAKEPQAVVFGKTGHAIDKAGTGEKYEKIEVAETRNTFANGEVRAQEVVVQPKPDGEVVAIDMDKNKPTNADRPVRKGGAGFGVSEKGASYTLTARDQHAVAYAIDSMGSNAMKSKNPHSGCREVECAPTLTTVDSAPVKHQGGTAVVAFLPGNSAKAQGLGAVEEVSPTLVKCQGESDNKVAIAAECLGVFDMEAGKSGARTDTSGVSPTVLALHGTDPHAVCIGFNCEAGTHDNTPKDNLGETLAASHKCGVAIGLDRASFNQGKNAQFGFKVEEECAPTVVAKGPGAVSFEPGIARREGAVHRFTDEVTSTLRSDMGDNLPAVAVDYIVRRLTPLECERLQGLPDGYTKIPHRGKPAEECPDTPRYKALGNGWAVNCARWICQRIQNYDKEHEQENTDGSE